MARGASRRNPLVEAIRLREEAAQLHAKLDALVRALIAEEVDAERQTQVRMGLLPQGGARQDESIREPLVLHRYWIVDQTTGQRRLTSSHLTAEAAAERYPGAQPESSTREERRLSTYSSTQAATQPGSGGSSEE